MVKQWRTKSLDQMFEQCKLEIPIEFADGGITFSKSYFYTNIPPFVHMKVKQEGLCPMHHTGRCYHNEFVKKRNMWHNRCTCTCLFCSTNGCDHGKSPDRGACSFFTCKRCANIRCPREWTHTFTQWVRPVQRKREGGGLYWENLGEHSSRQEFLQLMVDEMSAYMQHDEHNEWHKHQMGILLNNFKLGHVIVKCDFIQNIVHSRGQEVSSAWFGKRQTQFLSFVVWYTKQNANGSVSKYKSFYDYLSCYLKHNSLFFQKCLIHLLTHLRDEVKTPLRKVY